MDLLEFVRIKRSIILKEINICISEKLLDQVIKLYFKVMQSLWNLLNL